jgi:hypothetical protein
VQFSSFFPPDGIDRSPAPIPSASDRQDKTVDEPALGLILFLACRPHLREDKTYDVRVKNFFGTLFHFSQKFAQ